MLSVTQSMPDELDNTYNHYILLQIDRLVREEHNSIVKALPFLY